MKQRLDETLSAGLLRLAFAITTLIVLLQVVCGWRRVNGDGVSYLQIGQAILESHFRTGYAGYWAPLYGIVGALFSSAAERAGLDRLAGVQFLNGLLALGILIACVYFSRKLLDFMQVPRDSPKGHAVQSYALGLLAMLLTRDGGVTLVTPDLAVSALVFVAGGATLKLLQRTLDWQSAIGIGLIFGTGYWFKSIFFPLWFAWLLIAFAILWRRKAEWRWLALAGAVWLCIAVPLIGKTSETVGRMSFGENGRLSFLWYLNGLPNRYWQGDPPEHGMPVHRMVRLVENPRVYAFGNEFPKAAYPPWYDPAYGMLARV
jgi:hypothetical protein